MKAKYLFPIFFLFSSFSLAQNLNLTELFALCNKSNWDEVNESLLKRGWEYYASSKGDDTHYNAITWTFSKESYSDKAQGWFHLYTYEDFPNKIEYSFSNKTSYNIIKSGITTSGMKMIDNSIDDNEITSKYGSPNFIVTVKTERRESDESYYGNNSVTAYSIIVIKKAGIYDNENGLKKAFDDNGNIESEITLKDNKLNGIGKSYYSNGQIKIVSNFVNDNIHGISKQFDEDGNLTAEYNYVNGELTGLYKTYEKGRISLIGNLSNGKKNGQFRVYDSDGLLDKEYNMKLDLRDGAYSEYYYQEGKLIFKITGFYSGDLKSGLWQTIKIKEKASELISFRTYLNDIRNGDFKDVQGDSIIFGKYKNGELQGNYKVYRNLKATIFGGLYGDTTNCPIVLEGYYTNGLKNGFWKYYSWTGEVNKEGSYINDVKTGEWKYFFDKYVDEKNKPLEYSGKLFLIENYEDGKKSGKETRYAYLERININCDTTNNRNANPLDTCHKLSYKKVFENAYYKNNQLHGPIEIKDSVGVITFKGNFINGEKDGLWLESYSSDGFVDYGFYVYKKGNYSLGKRIGKWTMQWHGFTDENMIQTTYNYKNGLLDGKSIDFGNDGKLGTVYKLEMGFLKSVEVYDSLGKNIIRSYVILNETDNDFRCIKTETISDQLISQEYFIKKDNPKLISIEFFEAYFSIMTARKNGYPDGEYKIYDSSNKIILSGFFHKEEKYGKWENYFYDSKIYSQQEFTDGLGGVEKFFDFSSGKPFSGKFIQKFDNGKIKFEYRISNGFRDGKSKYFDQNGEIIKTEKYEKGILQN